ncbi:MAG: hypothetical protein ABFE01_20425 [Phycisphaerales bacterium]
MKNLSGDIPETLHNEILEWVENHKDVKIRGVVEAMAELWLALPSRLQALLLVSRRDSDDFMWTTGEIGQRYLAIEDVFCTNCQTAPEVVHRLLTMLRDYSLTGVGIANAHQLGLFLRCLTDLVRGINRETLAIAPEADRLAIQDIMAAMDRRAGVNLMSEIPATTTTMPASPPARCTPQSVARAPLSRRPARRGTTSGEPKTRSADG